MVPLSSENMFIGESFQFSLCKSTYFFGFFPYRVVLYIQVQYVLCDTKLNRSCENELWLYLSIC